MNIGQALQTGLIGMNRTLDNNAKAASDHQGTGQPTQTAEATGQASRLEEVVKGTVSETEAAAATKVVTATDEMLGTHVDIHV